jgi:hypothetical protein
VRPIPLLAALVALGACNSGDVPEPKQQRKAAAEPEPETVDIPQTVTALAPGTTPMPQRVAVIGLLNKRNGISQNLQMRPGQALRAGDVIVRLRACETTAPWEIQKLTGAFLQVDVRNPQGQYNRIFSGWVYKESPSLNVVEHPIYDIWPKSCAMTHPEAAASTVREGSAPSSRSRAPNSGASPPRPAPSAPAPEPEIPAEPPPSADDSIET